MIRRKQVPREERRRENVEVNLLAATDERGALSRARVGCALPFLGVGLTLVALEVVRTALI